MTYEAGTLQGEQLMIEDGTPRRRRRWILIAGIALLVAALAGYFLTRHKDAPHAAPADQAPTVTVLVPGAAAVARQVSATGSLAAKREMPVGVAGEGGMVSRVLVEPGQWVRAGQVLATIDRSVQVQTAESLASQIAVARSDLVLAQAELERAQSLVDRGFISKADVQRRIATRDAAAARLKVAGATYSEQRARNARLDIRAPAAGLILTRGVEPGQIVSSASGTLFRMARDGEMEMRAQLAENDLQGVRVGSAAKVTPVGDTRSFAGRVWQIAPVIDTQTRQGIARIQLSYDPALRPGGFASATITAGAESEPSLPQSALLSDDRGNYVYIVDAEDRAQRRDVKLGTVTEDRVAIASGLKGDERVVQSAGAFLNPGQKVKPVRARVAGQ
ncbi:efflux RND transporter periplasmic adaptor subunit [Sphingomonas citri]|uniref:efflux RND transporter periplasmic adaptor subunit n=1 Tax=unclassified Sphingomonas TaxID=196159 RepID=UPI001616ED18|nr:MULTISPECIES: efflux RND transporter periplasmic adaptor subunit [unclassified Sphingomonas]MBB3347366.1 RND family efflux transporter MFP subunit [Sphingomonas sp. BK069]MBB3472161.1 RND family efflux transporter MFP subunit [Sphingomonas sp. BK345]